MRAIILGSAAALALAGVAKADVTLVTLTYGDLSGNYTASSPTTGTFNAHAVDTSDLHSSGDVSRIVNPIGTADFQPGFVSGSDSSDFVLSMAVTHGASAGGGTGLFTATDIDGDTITGRLAGDWGLIGGFLSFVGTLSDVSINLPHNGQFDGSFTGSWSAAGLPPGPYNGAIVQLTANINNDFFASDFAGAATGLSAQITIPAPPVAYAAAGLLGALGGLGCPRRRGAARS